MDPGRPSCENRLLALFFFFFEKTFTIFKQKPLFYFFDHRKHDFLLNKHVFIDEGFQKASLFKKTKFGCSEAKNINLIRLQSGNFE